MRHIKNSDNHDSDIQQISEDLLNIDFSFPTF